MKHPRFSRPARFSATPIQCEPLELRQLLSTFSSVETFPLNGSFPQYVTPGPDGNVWVANTLADSVERMTPTGTITTFSTPKDVRGITAGPDGNLWATSEFGAAIDKITPAGVVTAYPLTNLSFVDPVDITTGSDGALWFACAVFNKIGRITTDGTYSDYTLPSGLSENGPIVSGPDGALWFTANNAIGRVTTEGGFSSYALSSSSDPSAITVGPDGNIWFTETNNNKVGRITPSGVVTEFDLPVADSKPDGIVTGPDGNLWIVQDVGYFASVTTAGVVTEYQTTPGSTADLKGITEGADNDLYLVDSFNDQITRVALTPATPNLTIVTVAATPTSTTVGQNIAISATITSTIPTGKTATGSVIFYQGTTSLGTAKLNSSGVATLNTTQLGIGTYSLSADYPGDANYLAANSSNPVTVDVEAPVSTGPTTGVLVPQYRLYSPVTQEHLYTTDLNEYNTLATRGWDQEGSPYQIYNGPITIDGIAAVPYYRLYNGTSKQHLWTTDLNENNTLSASGAWNAEGIDGYIFTTQVAGSEPLYRLYLNADGGLHLWSTDINEYNTLFAEDNWNQEGVIGYVIGS